MSDKEKLMSVKCPRCRKQHEKMLFWTGTTKTIWLYCTPCNNYLINCHTDKPEPHHKKGKFLNWI